jgi:glycosyltransferase involved in cell wall biosynthesis
MTDQAGADRLRLSLIVPCYTTERYEDLLRLCASIEAQSRPIDQVIFAVQQSAELRSRLAALLGESPLRNHVDVVFLHGQPGVARARNAGVESASGDIIAFTDDDAVLAEDWCEQTKRAYCEYPGMVGLAGAVLPLWDSPAMEWFPRELYWMLSCTYWHAGTVRRVRNGYGVNMSFRREAFAGGRRFNESLGVGAWSNSAWRGIGGEEPELSMRVCAGTRGDVLFVPDVRVWHRVRQYRLATRTVVRRGYWEGRFKALLATMPSPGGPVLDTEHELLRMVADNSVARLRLLARRPGELLRQQAVVTLGVTSVLCGYAEGRVRVLLQRARPRREQGGG